MSENIRFRCGELTKIMSSPSINISPHFVQLVKEVQGPHIEKLPNHFELVPGSCLPQLWQTAHLNSHFQILVSAFWIKTAVSKIDHTIYTSTFLEVLFLEGVACNKCDTRCHTHRTELDLPHRFCFHNPHKQCSLDNANPS